MRKQLYTLRWITAAILLLFAVACVALVRYSVVLGIVFLSVWAACVVAVLLVFVRQRKWLLRLLTRFCESLDPRLQQSLATHPMPVLAISGNGDILYHNDRFLRDVINGDEVIGLSVTSVFPSLSMKDIRSKSCVDTRSASASFTVYVNSGIANDSDTYVLYFCEDTELKQIAAEYTASRPVALLICIDNLEEAARNLREGERTRIAGQIETMLDDWISKPGGVLRKFGNDRFMAITESRCLNDMTKERFSILDSIRTTFADIKPGITVSIGVGQGRTMGDCERMARQALDMALARGGDQAAIKTANGYDFYGGRSRGVERRTKVRTRVMANALRDLIVGSDRVLVMGHRLSDLDSLGSAVALTTAARRLGVEAFSVVRGATTMAGELIRRYEDAGQSDVFAEPEDVIDHITDHTLLIITDTHTVGMLDSADIYNAAKRVAIIDHHRKMANCITGAELEYQESSSSSACELVTELLQYMGEDLIGKAEAEALLSGITLDTRNFVLRTGVRTFEAAAYLRRLGADTVSVKRMFADSLDTYQLKCELVNRAQVFHHIAIAASDKDYAGKRAAAAQAADELMTIHSTVASFVIFRSGDEINVSARSYGEFNVQLVMEAMGGGGHMTMAGTQQRDTSVADVQKQLQRTLEEYIIKNHLDI